MQLTKPQLFKGIIGLYILISALYIGYSAWQNFTVQYGQQSYEQGRQATVQQLIQQAKNEKCQPFSVYNEQEQIELINTTCLQQTATEEKTKEPVE